MSTYYEASIAPVVEDLIGKRQAKRFTIVRHYSTFEITESDAERIKESYSGLHVCYENFNGYKMIEAFAPFLSMIKMLYETYEREKTPEQFISQFPIYPLAEIRF